MQEPHKQGRAYQFGPESCAGSREGAGEALTGGSSGQPLSSEIIHLCVPTSSCQGEGNTICQRNQDRELTIDATESETMCMNGHLPRGNLETSAVSFSNVLRLGRLEKAVPYVQHARCRGVGRSRSTIEAGEQSRNTGGGVRGGKGIDQGKRKAGDHFWTQSQVNCGYLSVLHTASNVVLQRTVRPKVRAVCGSPARTDLCGGWAERPIPTATPVTLQVPSLPEFRGRPGGRNLDSNPSALAVR